MCETSLAFGQGFTFSSLCTDGDLGWETRSCDVLGNSENRVKSWLLFQSVNGQHHSMSIPGYPQWINVVLLTVG